jgi:serine/threonine protein kinase
MIGVIEAAIEKKRTSQNQVVTSTEEKSEKERRQELEKYVAKLIKPPAVLGSDYVEIFEQQIDLPDSNQNAFFQKLLRLQARQSDKRYAEKVASSHSQQTPKERMVAAYSQPSVGEEEFISLTPPVIPEKPPLPRKNISFDEGVRKELQEVVSEEMNLGKIARYVRKKRPNWGGAAGLVYIGWDRQRQDFVAVKILSNTELGKAFGDNALEVEAKVMARNEVPGFIQVRDFVDKTLIMEYLDPMEFPNMEELFGLISDENKTRSSSERISLPRSFAFEVLQRLAVSLNYLTDHDLSHNDMKPGNIYLKFKENKIASDNLTEEEQKPNRNIFAELQKEPAAVIDFTLDQLKIADFGLANDVLKSGEFKMDEKPVGTPNYIEPERYFDPTVRLKKENAQRADVYILGLMAFELFTLYTIFPHTSEEIEKLLEGGEIKFDTYIKNELAVLSEKGFSKEIIEVLQKALSYSPLKRYANIDIFIKNLERALFHPPLMTRIRNLMKAHQN